MNFFERFSLVALCLAVATASGAAVLTVDRYGPRIHALASDDPASVSTSTIAVLRERRAALIPIAVEAEREEQIRYVPSHVLPLLPTLAEHALRGETAELEPETSSLEDWTTETRRNVAAAPAPGPRLDVKAVVQLPWKTAAPAAPSQLTSLKERIDQISPGARRRLVTKFLEANAVWPPADIGLVAIKDQKVIELHARAAGGEWKLVHQYPVLAASGGAGPKLIQGDKQVPEGVYGISFLNPNSRYHVALRVNYPNAFDRKMAEKDGRKELGGDIMIHGKAASVGCLAIGDQAAEELFVLSEMIGLANVKLVIAPTDFRRYGVPEVAAGKPKWLPELYTEVASAMTEFKAPPSIGLLSFFGN